MAVGTSVARLTGYVRSILLVAALGNALHADIFAIANTIPNMLVVLLGAGIFNAVLVPQIVRAHRRGDGDAYVNQVITLFGALLLIATVLLTCAAPWISGLFLSPGPGAQSFVAQQHSSIAYYCLPQIFFYGMFAMIGQILNARGVFGPMTWAPVLNNVVAIAVLVGYLTRYGSGADRCAGYSTGQELLLGIGTTAGVILQCLALVPYLARAGIRYRPTARLFSPQIRTTLRIGAWTLAVVVVNQLAYGVVVRLASGGATSLSSCSGTGSHAGTGYTIYSSAYLLIMAPHAIITVSLMTASLPGWAALASSGELAELGRRLDSTLRLVMVAVVPGIALIELLAHDIANLAWGYGAGARSYERFTPTVACFGIALFFFTTQYVALRGLYALEATPAIFVIQSVIGIANVGFGVTLVHLTDPMQTAPALAAAFGGANAIGSLISWTYLRRRLGTAAARQTLAALARVTGCAVLSASACAALHVAVRGAPFAQTSGKTGSLAAATVTTAVFAGFFWWCSRVIRLPELTSLRAALAADDERD